MGKISLSVIKCILYHENENFGLLKVIGIHHFTTSKNMIKIHCIVCKCIFFKVLHSLKSSIYRGNFLKQWNNEYYFTLSKKFSNGPSDILKGLPHN